MPKPVAIVDCNNFYASCERVFNPKLNGKPIVVLSNNDGMIIARSNEAKALGIPMGEPLFKIKEIVEKHGVHVFSSNYTLYGDMSHRVMTALEQFSPDVEIYSIDEAFLNLEGFSYLDLTEYANEIRSTIKQWTGIPVSIGIASTKTLAKLANRFAKKHPECNGVLNIFDAPQGTIDSYLEQTDVEDIWGVGRQYTKLLYTHGIYNALQLTQAGDNLIRKKMTVMGLRTVYELRGIPCIKYDYSPPAKKAIISSRSFGKNVEDKEQIKEAISYFTTRATEKLRLQKSAANFLSVFLRTNPFKKTAQYHNGVLVTLPYPTNITSEFIEYAMRGVDQIFRPGFLYYKVGVMLSGIVPADTVQFTLFDRANRQKLAKIIEVMDLVNMQQGTGTIFFARQGVKREWKTRSEKKSSKFTTSWDELPEVKAEEEGEEVN
jgi:DNA polymerase V